MDLPRSMRDCEAGGLSKHHERRPADGEQDYEPMFSRGCWNNVSRLLSFFTDIKWV
jgi:hypothetical protein